MVHRRRKCCFFLLAATFFSACSVLFPPRDFREAFTEYLSLSAAGGENRRLLQDDKAKSVPVVENKEIKTANEVKRNEKDISRVPIFWDDGEFMQDDEKILQEEIQKSLKPSYVNRTIPQVPKISRRIIRSNFSQKKVQSQGKTDRSMAVLEYKLSQFQTVKYSNNTDTVKSQSAEHDNSAETTSRVLPVHLLIVTQRRSGSSFLGQIFNQNPWVFFHFEPLKLMEFKKGVFPNASVLLENLLKCRFDRTPYLMELYNNETLHRLSSKVLCSPPLCKVTMDYNAMKSTSVKVCGPLKTESATSVCNVYPHKVVKMIRLYSIESLKPLLLDRDLNVKIIHLLRDPRGTLASRSKEHSDGAKVLTPGKSLNHNAAYICRRMRNNFKFVRQNSVFMKDRYMRVRYEDIASDPEGWTRTLYRFAGMGDVPVDVFNWIQQNTRQSTREDAQDTYSTHRNSSATAQAWRHHIDFPVVNEIQRYCDDVLSEAGYVKVKVESDLSKADLSLVAPVT